MEGAVIATEGLTVCGIELELFRNGEGGDGEPASGALELRFQDFLSRLSVSRPISKTTGPRFFASFLLWHSL